MLMRFALMFSIGIPLATATGPLIDYVTYLGGSFDDSAAGVAVDSTGSHYVAGTTNSPDFPVTSTPLGVPGSNGDCAFVTKFNPSGTAIDFSICLAASRAIAFALDSGGNMYLAVENGGRLGASFAVVKLDPTGQTVLYNTMIAGSPESIAVDGAGNVYVAGSAGPGLVTTAGAYQPQPSGGQCSEAPNGTEPCTNAFALKLNASGGLAWSTYLGGSGPDDAHAIAVDSSGNVWLAGATVSPNFPTTQNALSRTFHGEIDLDPLRFGDGFVAKLDATGSHLLYSTYLGGSAADAALSVAVDNSGAAYVVGGTQSADFPTTPGSFETTYNGSPSSLPSLSGNGFAAKFDASGNLIYSTFIGSGEATPVVVDASGQAYVSLVQTAQPGATQPGCTWQPNVYVLNASGSAVAASSPIPGGYLALDGKGGLYSAGVAYALIFFSTPHAFQTEYGGGNNDAFAAKVDFSQPAGPSLASIVNAASFSPGYASSFPNGAVAPGEIVSIFGAGFGYSPTVTFGQTAAPVLSASGCQINAVVPFEAPVGQSTLVTVQFAEQVIGPVKLPVVAAAPGLFTITESGTGQGAILNQDNSVNSASNPAARGSIVAIYLTGTGELAPPITDGALGPLTPPFPAPEAAIGATIGGVPATVVFAGQAPGLIAGATQVNVQVPDAPTGVVPITLEAAGYYAGGSASQVYQSVTIAIK